MLRAYAEFPIPPNFIRRDEEQRKCAFGAWFICLSMCPVAIPARQRYPKRRLKHDNPPKETE